MTKVVPTNQVISVADISPYDVRKIKQTLIKQGQIEPLQVHYLPAVDKYLVFEDDPWGNEIVQAAHELEWPTLLISVQNHYEQ